VTSRAKSNCYDLVAGERSDASPIIDMRKTCGVYEEWRSAVLKSQLEGAGKESMIRLPPRTIGIDFTDRGIERRQATEISKRDYGRKPKEMAL
jgi:hypothetical protein